MEGDETGWSCWMALLDSVDRSLMALGVDGMDRRPRVRQSHHRVRAIRVTN